MNKLNAKKIGLLMGLSLSASLLGGCVGKSIKSPITEISITEITDDSFETLNSDIDTIKNLSDLEILILLSNKLHKLNLPKNMIDETDVANYEEILSYYNNSNSNLLSKKVFINESYLETETIINQFTNVLSLPKKEQKDIITHLATAEASTNRIIKVGYKYISSVVKEILKEEINNNMQITDNIKNIDIKNIMETEDNYLINFTLNDNSANIQSSNYYYKLPKDSYLGNILKSTKRTIEYHKQSNKIDVEGNRLFSNTLDGILKYLYEYNQNIYITGKSL